MGYRNPKFPSRRNQKKTKATSIAKGHACRVRSRKDYVLGAAVATVYRHASEVR